MSAALRAQRPPAAPASSQNGSRPTQHLTRSAVAAQQTARLGSRQCPPAQLVASVRHAAARRRRQLPCVSASAAAALLDLSTAPSTSGSGCETCGPLGFQTGFASAFTLGRHIGSGEPRGPVIPGFPLACAPCIVALECFGGIWASSDGLAPAGTLHGHLAVLLRGSCASDPPGRVAY